MKKKLENIPFDELKSDFEKIKELRKQTNEIEEKYSDLQFGTLYGLEQSILKEFGRRSLLK